MSRGRWLGVAAALAAVATGAAGCCPPGGLALEAERDRGRAGDAAARARERAAPADAVITLYRDGALVEERHRVAVDADGVAVLPLGGDALTATVTVGALDAALVSWSRQPGGVAGDEIEARAGDHTVRGRAVGEPVDGIQGIAAADGVHLVRSEAVTGGRAAALRAVVHGARGHVTLTVRYSTPRLRWQTSYTLLEERPGRGRLYGALALDNQTGRRWDQARFTLIDRPQPKEVGVADDRFQLALPGRFAVGPGEQRLDLGLRTAPVAVRATLVYDPVGTRLDGNSRDPTGDEGYGVQAWPSRIDESVVVDVTDQSEQPLPAGVLRLVAVGADGHLAWRGEGKLPPPADDARRIVAIAIGRAADVTGARTRTMFQRDEDRQRLAEEFTLRFRNDRDRPIEVLAREHLYRGSCWTLAYHSTGQRLAKEGQQQIGLGVVVPARATATIVYRVIYTWDDGNCAHSKSPS